MPTWPRKARRIDSGVYLFIVCPIFLWKAVRHPTPLYVTFAVLSVVALFARFAAYRAAKQAARPR